MREGKEEEIINNAGIYTVNSDHFARLKFSLFHKSVHNSRKFSRQIKMFIVNI